MVDLPPVVREEGQRLGKEVQAARDREQLAVQRRGAQEACPVRTEVIWGLPPAGRDRAAWDPPAARAHPAVLGQAPDPATWDRPEAWVPLEGWVHPVEWVPPAGWAHPAAREEADGRQTLADAEPVSRKCPLRSPTRIVALA